MLKPKVCRLRTSNSVGGWFMFYQMPWPAIKACEVVLLYAGWGIPCRLHPAATQLVSNKNAFINVIFLFFKLSMPFRSYTDGQQYVDFVTLTFDLKNVYFL